MDEYTNNERENLIMKAVIKSLTDLGGIEKRKEVKRNIYDNSTLIPEHYMVRVSKPNRFSFFF